MNIFKMDLKRGLKPLIYWTAASTAVMMMFTLLYPSMMDSDFMALMNAKIDALPKELVDAFHMSGQDFTSLPQFFATMFQFVLMVACIFGAILGFTALSREESEGTIEFLYAKPVRRTRIVSAKLAAALLSFVMYFGVFGAIGLICAICVCPPGVALSDLVLPVLAVLGGGALAGILYLLCGLAISAFLKKTRHAASLAAALFFITYLVGSIPSMMGMLNFLKWLSPINYFYPSEVVMGGIDGLNILIFVVIAGIFIAVTYSAYRKKDFAV